MKTIILSLAFFLVLTMGFCQTEELEKQSLTERYNQGEFEQTTYQTYAKEWRILLNKFGGYPDISYDKESNSIKYKEEYEFPNISKKDIYNRIMEWAAINFGMLESVLHYENYESGKIILKGRFDILYVDFFRNFWGIRKERTVSRTSYQTYIFTIKDNKLKMQIVNFTYEYKLYGYFVNNNYVPTEIYKLDVQNVYPVTKHHQREWMTNLDLLVKTKNKIDYFMINVKDYIISKDKDYQF